MTRHICYYELFKFDLEFSSFLYCHWLRIRHKIVSCRYWTVSLPDDGSSKHLRNVGQFLRDYTA
jgi:hypothetical protein